MSEELYVAVRRSPEDNRWSHMHFGKAPLPVIDDLMMLSGTNAVNPGDIITVISVDDISSIDNKTWNVWIVNDSREIVMIRSAAPTKRMGLITWIEFWENHVTTYDLYDRMQFASKLPRLHHEVVMVLYEISKLIKDTDGSFDECHQAIEIIEDYVDGTQIKKTNVWYINSVIAEIKDDWNPYDYVIKYAFTTSYATERNKIINMFCATVEGHPDPGTKNAILTEIIPLHKLLLEVSR